VIDPYKLTEFDHYARPWIPLVARFGGTHHGYLMPSEGANNIAYASFSFESLAAYEKYRQDSMRDADCLAAYAYGLETRCIVSYERSFMRPVFS
jgi:NIPSNAP